MDFLGHDDIYLPANPKASAQGLDNYGIYDLVCTDAVYSTYSSNTITSVRKKERENFLAIQAYSVQPIACDFQSIVSTYN
jgi:hypothetical protein